MSATSSPTSERGPFVGFAVDVGLGAVVGYLIGLGGGIGSRGYVLLVNLVLWGVALALPMGREFTGGPRAAGWSGLTSAVLGFAALCLAIVVGAAQTLHISAAAAFAAHARMFVWPFMFAIVLMLGPIAWTLTFKKRKPADISGQQANG